MTRTVESPFYIIDENEEEMLIYKIVEEYEDYEIIVDGESQNTSELVSKKRLMPNGDVYIINGNIEQYIPFDDSEITRKGILKELSELDKIIDRPTEELYEKSGVDPYESYRTVITRKNELRALLSSL